jgi:hypothetical protein
MGYGYGCWVRKGSGCFLFLIRRLLFLCSCAGEDGGSVLRYGAQRTWPNQGACAVWAPPDLRSAARNSAAPACKGQPAAAIAATVLLGLATVLQVRLLLRIPVGMMMEIGRMSVDATMKDVFFERRREARTQWAMEGLCDEVRSKNRKNWGRAWRFGHLCSRDLSGHGTNGRWEFTEAPQASGVFSRLKLSGEAQVKQAYSVSRTWTGVKEDMEKWAA